jgi:hypothetical protein
LRAALPADVPATLGRRFAPTMNVDLDDIGPVTYDRMALIQRIYRMRYFILFGRPVTIEFDSQKRLDLGNSV